MQSKICLLLVVLLLASCGNPDVQKQRADGSTMTKAEVDSTLKTMTPPDTTVQEDARYEAKFGALLTRLESHLDWKSFEERWKTERFAWVDSVNADRGLRSKAEALLRLEANIKPEVFNSAWPRRRTDWVLELDRAYNYAQLAEGLILLDAGLLPKAFTDVGLEHRKGWRSECKMYQSLRSAEAKARF